MTRRAPAAFRLLVSMLACACALQAPLRLPAVGPVGAAKSESASGQPTMMGTLIV
jgi:hypothetical protein